MPKPAKRTILFMAFDGTSILNLSGPLAVFHAATRYGDIKPAYDVHVVTMRGGAVTSQEGVGILTSPAKDFRFKPIDTIIVPGGWPAVRSALDDRKLIAWIAKYGRTARRVCSVCSGAFLLAEAKLLDGKRAATHWLVCDELRARYPAVTVEADPIFVQDGRVWTSAGASAGIDLALALIEADHGRELAMQVARIGVVLLKRPGGQSQFSMLLKTQTNDAAPFSELHDWLIQHVVDPGLTVERLAEQAGMSLRNFARVYTAKVGRTPAKTIELFRLQAARRLLEDTNERITSVAHKLGFGDDERMRATFQRHLNVSPQQYRARFGQRELG